MTFFFYIFSQESHNYIQHLERWGYLDLYKAACWMSWSDEIPVDPLDDKG